MILALIEHYSNGNKAQFANLIGITPQGLSTWLKRGTFDIEQIFSKCKGISTQWLLTGRGDMLKTKHTSVSPTASAAPVADIKDTKNTADIQTIQHKNIIKSTAAKGIPLIPIEAIAGFCSVDELGIRTDDCPCYLVPEFQERGAEFMIRVPGLSMEPLYNNGDILACRKVRDVVFFQWGNIYVLDTSQGSLVKHIYEDKDNKERVMCVSENASLYPSYSIPKSDIRSLSIVIGLIRLV